MLTFELDGLMDPKNMNPKKIIYNNFVLNGLNGLNGLNNNNNIYINDEKEQLCKSVARNFKKNFWWIDKERFNEK